MIDKISSYSIDAARLGTAAQEKIHDFELRLSEPSQVGLA